MSFSFAFSTYFFTLVMLVIYLFVGRKSSKLCEMLRTTARTQRSVDELLFEWSHCRIRAQILHL